VTKGAKEPDRQKRLSSRGDCVSLFGPVFVRPNEARRHRASTKKAQQESIIIPKELTNGLRKYGYHTEVAKNVCKPASN